MTAPPSKVPSKRTEPAPGRPGYACAMSAAEARRVALQMFTMTGSRPDIFAAEDVETVMRFIQHDGRMHLTGTFDVPRVPNLGFELSEAASGAAPALLVFGEVWCADLVSVCRGFMVVDWGAVLARSLVEYGPAALESIWCLGGRARLANLITQIAERKHEAKPR